MSSEQSGYGRKWKRWLAIYLAVGAVAYAVLYLALLPSRRRWRRLPLLIRTIAPQTWGGVRNPSHVEWVGDPVTLSRSMATMERVTGIGGVFQRAGQAASLRDWYAEHLGIDISDWGGKPFEWTPGGSTTWAIFDHDTEYFGRPEQAYMVNFRVADLDAMLAQLRSAGVEVVDALEESELGRFGWAVDPEGTRFELWEPPPGG